MITILILLFVLALILKHKTKYNPNTKNGPPGPPTVPFIGNLHQIKTTKEVPVFEAIKDLCRQYGQIMSLKIGVNQCVVVEDYKTIKEILNQDEFAYRSATSATLERSYGKFLGIIWNNGSTWKEIRRFTIKTLKEFGFGKTRTMQSAIEEEMRDLLQRLDSRLQLQGSTIPINHLFVTSVLNVIWRMVAGVRFHHDDSELLEFIRLTDALSKSTPSAGLLTAFPFLRHVLPIAAAKRQGYKRLFSYFTRVLRQRRRQGTYLEEQNDFIDVFLKSAESDKNNIFTDEQFNVLIVDLFQAGSETTSNTLEYGILYMMLNPGVQERVRKEIHSVIGRSKLPTYDDRKVLPYTEATVLEILRNSNVLPFTVRQAVTDTTIGSYDVRKGTDVLCSIYGAHMDKVTWIDPYNFRPERFLDSNNKIINSNRLLSFGMGKRVCIGEAVARASLFCVFTSMLQNYSFQTVDGVPPLSIPDVGFTLSPKSFSAVLTKV